MHSNITRHQNGLSKSLSLMNASAFNSKVYFIRDCSVFSRFYTLGFRIAMSVSYQRTCKNAPTQQQRPRVWGLKARIFDKMMMSIATFGVHLLQICQASTTGTASSMHQASIWREGESERMKNENVFVCFIPLVCHWEHYLFIKFCTRCTLHKTAEITISIPFLCRYRIYLNL